MKKLLAFMLMFAFAVVLVGCGGGKKGPTSIDVKAQGNKTTITVGEEVQLTATVLPAGVDQGVTWSSVLPNIASVDANGKVKGVSQGTTIIRATSTANTEVTGQISIKVTADGEEDYPDLGGLKIVIAQSESAISEIDPFHEDYSQNNKEAKQRAWEWVGEKFNCTFEVVAYKPEHAWGPPRWDYLLQQAASNVSEYDIIVIPDDRIGMLVEGNALIDVSTWYAAYGNDYMDPTYKQSGTYKGGLYSMTEGTAGIYNVLYYNIGFVNRLGIPEPAEIFNDGDWTYTRFKEYILDAQGRLGDNQYVLTGNPSYYWIGMLNAGGVAGAEPSTLKLNIDHPYAVQAAELLREVFDEGAFDPNFMVEQYMTAWNEQRAIFAAGDLWFINNATRWPENLWGTPESTQYGYVPWPRPDDISKEQQGVAAGGTATYAMPIGRESFYAQYGPECTSENVYRAFITTFFKTDEFYKEMNEQDEDALKRAFAERWTESEESQKALMYMADRFKVTGFFDPMSLPTNAIQNMWSGSFAVAMRQYVQGDIATYQEVVAENKTALQDALTKAYS